MESDIILEGFLETESKHGLRYMRLVGDGDSSVFAKIREEVPNWGRYVVKEKCYRSNLEKLVNDSTLYKGKHHLTRTTRVRLVSSLRCAFLVRSKQYSEKKLDRTTAVKKLKADIKNSAYHIFGQHKDCSDFCKAKTQSEEKQTSSNNQNETSCDSSENTTILIDEQNDFWNEGTSISSQEEARNGTTIDYRI